MSLLRFASRSQPGIQVAVRKLKHDARESNAERRSHGRTPLFKPVILRMGEDFSVRHAAFTRDISPTGVGLLHSFPIEPAEVMLTTQLHNRETIELIVDVTWCMSCGEGWYISGGAFNRLVESGGSDL